MQHPTNSMFLFLKRFMIKRMRELGKISFTEDVVHTYVKGLNLNADRVPEVTTNTPDDEVKRRTGFQTMNHLLLYVFAACNGVHKRMVARDTILTWFEEWFFHFEYKWGRTITCLLDVKKIYGPDKRYLRKVIVQKYSIEHHAKLIWPIYASYAEDCEMHRSKWNTK